ncbi:MAG: hypothetical protein WKF79_10625 [Nocardioides sp.]
MRALAARLGFLSVCLVAGLLVAGCGGGGPSADPGESSSAPSPRSGTYEITDADFTALAALMDDRAQALLEGRKPAFLATVDPTNSELLAEQEVFFDNVTALPVDKLFYDVSTDGFVPAKIRGNDPVVRPQVVEHLSLRGVFDKPVGNGVALTFVKRDGEWVLGHEEIDEVVEPQERPWFGGPIEVTQDGGLLVVTDRGADESSREVATSVRVHLDAVAALLETPPGSRLLVDATSNGLANELSNASGENAGAVSFGVAAIDDDGNVRGLAGEVIKLNPELVDELIGNSVLMRHELTHYLLDFGITAPIWASEGIAEVVAEYPRLLTEAVGDAALVRDIENRPVELTGSGIWGNDPELDYLVARATAEYLVKTYGFARYREMLETFQRRASGVSYGEAIVDETLRKVYGESEAEVARHTFDLLRGLAP